jgi:hypothetical protein
MIYLESQPKETQGKKNENFAKLHIVVLAITVNYWETIVNYPSNNFSTRGKYQITSTMGIYTICLNAVC